MRFSSAVVVASCLFAATARADDPPKPFWAVGPAGGAFGLFVEGGATVGTFGFESFAAASFGAGASLRWFEASVTGYYGGSFDSLYSGGAFLVRLAARVPLRYVAISFGPTVGYVEVPNHTVSGVAFEPLSINFEFDPVCHLRLGLLAAWVPQVFGDVAQGIVHAAITVGYSMGVCTR